MAKRKVRDTVVEEDVPRRTSRRLASRPGTTPKPDAHEDSLPVRNTKGKQHSSNDEVVTGGKGDDDNHQIRVRLSLQELVKQASKSLGQLY